MTRYVLEVLVAALLAIGVGIAVGAIFLRGVLS